MGGAGDPVRPRVDCLLVDTIIVRAAAGAALPTNIIILSEGGVWRNGPPLAWRIRGVHDARRHSRCNSYTIYVCDLYRIKITSLISTDHANSGRNRANVARSGNVNHNVANVGVVARVGGVLHSRHVSIVAMVDFRVFVSGSSFGWLASVGRAVAVRLGARQAKRDRHPPLPRAPKRRPQAKPHWPPPPLCES